MGRPVHCECVRPSIGERGHDGQHARYNRTVPGIFFPKCIITIQPRMIDASLPCWPARLKGALTIQSATEPSRPTTLFFRVPKAPQPAQPVININVGCTDAGLVFIICPAMTQSDIYQRPVYGKKSVEQAFFILDL